MTAKSSRRHALTSLMAGGIGALAATGSAHAADGPAPDRLAQLADHHDIVRILYLYARGFDRGDEAVLRSCFHPGATLSIGAFDGPAEAFLQRTVAVVRTFASSSHIISNPLVDIAGDAAISECHYLALFRAPAPHGEGEEDVVRKGRYIDRFERRGGFWKIARRITRWDMERYVPPAARTLDSAPPDHRSRAWPDDPLYAALAELGG